MHKATKLSGLPFFTIPQSAVADSSLCYIKSPAPDGAVPVAMKSTTKADEIRLSTDEIFLSEDEIRLRRAGIRI